MSVVPQDDLRPERTTDNYGWPVPGDAGPADYVTDTGALADAIDETLADDFEPLHIYLTQGGTNPFPSHPRPGQIVVVHVTGSAFISTDDGATNPVWTFRADELPQGDGRWAWRFAGGSPMNVQRQAPPAGLYTGNGRYLIIGPVIYNLFAEGVEVQANFDFGAAIAAVGNSTGYAIFAPASAHDAWGVSRLGGGVEVGTNDGIRSANVMTGWRAGFPNTPTGRYLALFGGAPVGQVFSLSWGWINMTPMWVLPPATPSGRLAPHENEALPPPQETTPFPDDWPEHGERPDMPVEDPPFMAPPTAAPTTRARGEAAE